MKFLIANGAPKGKLAKFAIDLHGANQGYRPAAELTLYLAIGTQPDGSTQGIVYIYGYGWVDWETFGNTWL